MKIAVDRSPRRALGVIVMLIAGLSGCGDSGPAIVPVSGDVTLDGAPLGAGVVSFVSESGHVGSAKLDAQGNFQLNSQYGAGIPLGNYQVTVLPAAGDPNQVPMESAAPPTATPIPERYQYAARSGLRATVEEGSADFHFELSSKP